MSNQTTQISESPRLFLTDWASYNNGTQFEFGHWVDLGDFSDADEFMEYVKNHFEECDKKSPLDEYGSTREEILYSDNENLPGDMSAEYFSLEELQLIYDWMELDEDSKMKVELYKEVTCESLEYCMDHYEDMQLVEENDAYDYILEMNPALSDVMDMNIGGVRIDEDEYFRYDWTAATYNGTTYWVRTS